MFLFVVVWRQIPEALQVRLKHRHEQCMPRLSFQDHERMPSHSAFNYTRVIPLAPKTASIDLTAFLHQPFPGEGRKRELWAQPRWHHSSWADVPIHPGFQFCAACKDLENFSARISDYPMDLWVPFFFYCFCLLFEAGVWTGLLLHCSLVLSQWNREKQLWV